MKVKGWRNLQVFAEWDAVSPGISVVNAAASQLLGLGSEQTMADVCMESYVYLSLVPDMNGTMTFLLAAALQAHETQQK